MSANRERLDEEHLDRVPFGRNRVLSILGTTLVALAVRMALPSSVGAFHRPSPWPCGGFHECECCYGSDCCGLCAASYTCNNGTSQCWYVYTSPDPVTGCSDVFRCCDWRQNTGAEVSACICREYLGQIC